MSIDKHFMLALLFLLSLTIFITGCASFDIDTMPSIESSVSDLPLTLDLENTFNYETQNELYWEVVEVKLNKDQTKGANDHYVEWYKANSEQYAGEELVVSEKGEAARFTEQIKKAKHDRARRYNLINNMTNKVCNLGSTINFEYFFDTNAATLEFVVKLGRAHFNDTLSVQKKISAPLEDFVTQQLETSLTVDDANSIGKMSITVDSFDEGNSWLFYPLTGLTIGTIGVFRIASFPLGIPYYSPETKIELTATVCDNDGYLVVSYPIKSSAKAYSAWYWGYTSGLDSRNAANARAWQAAIDEIIYHLDRDADMLRARCKPKKAS